MRRRGFVQRTASALGALAAAALPLGIARMLAPSAHAEPHVRLTPPGALADDRRFVEACIGCGLCAEVCPPRCIRFRTRDGGARVNTPYINPTVRACTLCGKCAAACPTAALSPVPIDEVRMGIARIDQAACYPWIDRGICGACVSICPLGERAIHYEMWNQYRPVVHTGCVGCGLCVEVCPHPSLPIRIVGRDDGVGVRTAA